MGAGRVCTVIFGFHHFCAGTDRGTILSIFWDKVSETWLLVLSVVRSESAVHSQLCF